MQNKLWSVIVIYSIRLDIENCFDFVDRRKTA